MTPRHPFIYALAGVLLFVGMVMGGCATPPTPTPVPTPAPTNTPAPATVAPANPPATPMVAGPTAPPPPKIGGLAPDFTLESLAGETVSLADFRGKKVMLNFFATWCPHCQAETPFMVQVYNEMQGQDFEIVAVSLGETRDRVEAYQKEYSVTYTLLMDPQGIAANLYYVSSIPLTVLVDENGIILSGYGGELDDETLRKLVAELME